MSYIKVTVEQIGSGNLPEELKGRDLSNYKLCYVDSIPQTVFDYRPEIREKYKDIIGLPYEEYFEEQWKHPDMRYEDLPNPEYVAGEQELFAYFTPKDLAEQWGDDWNDIPYEHNAEMPYDDVVVETKITESGMCVASKVEHYDIVVVLCCVKSNNYMLPKDYGYGGNSPFSVDMIDGGAVAWIYDPADGKIGNMTSIHAGCGLESFVNALGRIEENNPNYKPYVEEDY